MKLRFGKIAIVVSILFFIAILVILWMYSFVGKTIEDKVNNLVVTHAKHNVKILNYKRSWFSSEATIIVYFDSQTVLHWQNNKFTDFVNTLTPQKEFNYVLFKVDIKHGPFIYYHNKFKLLASVINAQAILTQKQRNIIESHLLDDENKKQLLLPILHKIIDTNIVIDFSGKGNINVFGNKFIYKTSDINIDWHGFIWQVNFSKYLQNLESDFDFFGCDISTNDTTLNLSNFNIHNSYTKIADKLLPIYKTFVLPNLQIKIYAKNDDDANIESNSDDDDYIDAESNNDEDDSTNTITQINLANVRYQMALKPKSQDENVFLRSDVSLTVDNIKVNDKVYSNLVFIWDADNLTVDNYQEFFHSISQLRQAERPSGLALAYFFEVILRLLNNGIVLDVHQFSVNTPWGKLDLVANAEFKHKINTKSWILGLLANSEVLIQLSVSHDLVLHVLEEYFKYNAQYKNTLDADVETTKTVTDAKNINVNNPKNVHNIHDTNANENNVWHEQALTTLNKLLETNKLFPNNLNQYVVILNYARHKILLNGQELNWRF